MRSSDALFSSMSNLDLHPVSMITNDIDLYHFFQKAIVYNDFHAIQNIELLIRVFEHYIKMIGMNWKMVDSYTNINFTRKKTFICKKQDEGKLLTIWIRYKMGVVWIILWLIIGYIHHLYIPTKMVSFSYYFSLPKHKNNHFCHESSTNEDISLSSTLIEKEGSW